ncbi:MAG: Trp biosynthesis-associated membrane protein [Nocardioides sp.]|nr:Trp biosynthesis-associated membrane protein [Nocardioides sp.]
MPEPRKTFGPIVLVGLTSSALAAVAGSKDWLVSEVSADQVGGETLAEQIGLNIDAPLAGSLSLVLLAAWGVILVTRGRVRRVVAVLAVVTSLGVLATALSARWTMRDDLRARFADHDIAAAYDGSHFTGWWYAALVASVIAVVAAVAALKFVAHWPEMGGRYDAPGSDDSAPEDLEDASSVELWKAIDEGRDPTV